MKKNKNGGYRKAFIRVGKTLETFIMKNSLNKSLLACFFAILLGGFTFNAEAQTCNKTPGPTNSGFHTAGGFGGCTMQFDITYDCGSGPTTVTCWLDGVGDGFELPAGCCLLGVDVFTPNNGMVHIDPNLVFQSTLLGPSGLPFPLSTSPCDQHDANEVHAHFDFGACGINGSIHIN